jgi:HD-like signal output (HDOD) protein
LLESIIEDTDSLPSIPVVASRLLELLQDIEATPADIGTLIQVDPALSMKVLQLANSAMFAAASPVHSVERAILLLGFNTVRFLITGMVVLQVARQITASEIINPESFWNSAFRGAVTARFLAERYSLPHVNEAYLAGLIREIGQIALVQCAYEPYLPVVRAARSAGVRTLVKEREMLGFTHADVGALLVVKWNLDAGLADIIRAYPEPSLYPEIKSPVLVSIVHLADILSLFETPEEADFERVAEELDPFAKLTLTTQLGEDITSTFLQAAWEEICPLLESSNPFI